jgi:hypothetical protein
MANPPRRLVTRWRLGERLAQVEREAGARRT